MYREILHTIKSPYRDDMHIAAYRFGKGEKSACIVGPTRGNEVQQLYICSQIMKALTRLEKTGAIVSNNQILIIPAVNYYSLNIEKRFWAMDHTDINRMSPGSETGETTTRIANAIFQEAKEYNYVIQFVSFHLPGNFLPHVRMMSTGNESTSLASLFGLPYVLTRKTQPIDTGTLNFSLSAIGVHAFSIYTEATDQIVEESAMQAVSSVLRFLKRMGIIKYNCHNGFIASMIEDTDLMSIKTDTAGIYRRKKKPGDEVVFGEVLAEIIDPIEGDVISQIIAPSDGIIFFTYSKPLVIENTTVYELLRRVHM